MTDSPAPASPAQMLCFDIYATNLAFGRLYKPLLDPLGMTYPQYLVLLTLWGEDGQSVGQIGTVLGLDSSTLTPLIKRLESADLVSRKRDEADERRVVVSLTATGRDLQDRAADIPACVAGATGLSPAEMQHLEAMLRRLRRALREAPLAPNAAAVHVRSR